MGKHVVCRVGELPPGEVKIVDVNGIEIGVYNIDGEYHAIHNLCPHRGAPLCEGRITGLLTGPEPGKYEFKKNGEIVRCPWHGYEFDITSGEFVLEPDTVRSMTYDVTVEPADNLDCSAQDDDVDCSVRDDIIDEEFDGCEPEVDTYPVTIEDDVVMLHV